MEDRPDSEVVYYESIKRDLKTRLTYSGFLGELEHLKIKTRLIDERFPSVMGEYVFLNR